MRLRDWHPQQPPHEGHRQHPVHGCYYIPRQVGGMTCAVYNVCDDFSVRGVGLCATVAGSCATGSVRRASALGADRHRQAKPRLAPAHFTPKPRPHALFRFPPCKVPHFWAKVRHFWAKVRHFWGKAQHFGPKARHFWAKVRHFRTEAPHFWGKAQHFSNKVRHFRGGESGFEGGVLMDRAVCRWLGLPRQSDAPKTLAREDLCQCHTEKRDQPVPPVANSQ